MSGIGEETYSGQDYCLVFNLKLIYPYSWVKTTPLFLQCIRSGEVGTGNGDPNFINQLLAAESLCHAVFDLHESSLH